MAENKTLLVVDGHSAAFRAFYALDPANFRTQEGQYTNAVFGFLRMLLTFRAILSAPRNTPNTRPAANLLRPNFLDKLN